MMLESSKAVIDVKPPNHSNTINRFRLRGEECERLTSPGLR